MQRTPVIPRNHKVRYLDRLSATLCHPISFHLSILSRFDSFLSRFLLLLSFVKAGNERRGIEIHLDSNDPRETND